MTRGGPGIPRRFHFKSPRLNDPDIQRFAEWSDENHGFYSGFREGGPFGEQWFAPPP